MTTNYPEIRKTKRKMSLLEQHQMQRKRKHANPLYENEIGVFPMIAGDDESQASELEPIPRKKQSKTCGLCRQQGHKVTNCPALTRFTGAFLPIRRPYSKEVRESLALELSIPQKFDTHNREERFGEMVHHSFPRRSDHDCIIIHNRLFINKDLPIRDVATNYCFECTLLQGTIHGVQETVSRGLFTLTAVVAAIRSNQNSLVKSELHLSLLSSQQEPQGLTQESSV